VVLMLMFFIFNKKSEGLIDNSIQFSISEGREI